MESLTSGTHGGTNGASLILSRTAVAGASGSKYPNSSSVTETFRERSFTDTMLAYDDHATRRLHALQRDRPECGGPAVRDRHLWRRHCESVARNVRVPTPRN